MMVLLGYFVGAVASLIGWGVLGAIIFAPFLLSPSNTLVFWVKFWIASSIALGIAGLVYDIISLLIIERIRKKGV
ncbi:hypothetical protein [Marinicauda salina]|uniref:hypothetical protein n=1 Tax=Marinicauda salina TaxID=2135793 RepID=UPI0011B2575F|nr:hypothetical protein [Marinicauda salina]